MGVQLLTWYSIESSKMLVMLQKKSGIASI